MLLPVFHPRRKTYSNCLYLAANLAKSRPTNALTTPLWVLDFAAPPDSQETTTSRATTTNGKCGSPPSDPLSPAQYGPNYLTIFQCGSNSNWNCEMNQQPAGIAITYINNCTPTLGFTATDFDAALCAIRPPTPTRLHPTSRPSTHHLLNKPAIHAVTNLRPHAGQSYSRDFRNMLTELLSGFETPSSGAPQRGRQQASNHLEPKTIAHH